MNVLVVCAHEMDRMGFLNTESKGRCKVASLLLRNHHFDRIIVPGWAYRDDSSITISSRMKHYLVHHCNVSPSIIEEESRSRDTVGDAVFSRLQLADYLDQLTSLTVVTSSYHVARAQKIFKFVFSGYAAINSFDSYISNSPPSNDSHELSSLEAFYRTFLDVSPGDIDAILSKLCTCHPYYNGDKYSRLVIS